MALTLEVQSRLNVYINFAFIKRIFVVQMNIMEKLLALKIAMLKNCNGKKSI